MPVSLKPSEAVHTGGFATSGPEWARVTSAIFTPNDPKTNYGPQAAVMITPDESDGTEIPIYGLGVGKKVQPTADGNNLVALSGDANEDIFLSDNCGWVKFIASLVSAGFNENNLAKGISSLIGVHAQFIAEEKKNPDGTVAMRVGKDGNSYPKTQLKITGTIEGASKAAAIKATPAATAAAAGAAVATASAPATAPVDLKATAVGFIDHVLAATPDWVAGEVGHVIKLSLPVLKARAAKYLQTVAGLNATDRPKVIALLSDPTFAADLEAIGRVAYNAAESEFTKLA